MEKVLLLLCCLLIFSNLALAQSLPIPGSINLYGNEAGTVCGIYDNVPGQIYNIYVFHMYATEVASAGFKVEQQDGANLTWLGDSATLYNLMGTSDEGMEVLYWPSCLSSPLHILTISYQGNVSSSDCSYLRVVGIIAGDPPYAAGCDPYWPMTYDASGGSLAINPTDDCPCNVPVEDTTWGKVKALYN
jgi:hypothetical protein